jgi:hypothetical protein
MKHGGWFWGSNAISAASLSVEAWKGAESLAQDIQEHDDRQ